MDVLGVEIRTDALAVAHVRRSLFAIKAESHVLIRGETLKARLDGLRSYISGNAIENPRIALVLPRSATISSVIEIPAPDPSAISGILRFELEKHIPFKTDDAYWGFEVIRKKENIFSVLFAAVRKATVDKLVEEFRCAGLVPDSVGFWQAGLINALAHWKNTAEGRVMAIAGINAGEVTLDVFSDFVPVYSKSISAVRLREEAWTGVVKRELMVFLRSSDTSSRARKLDECAVISEQAPEGSLLAELSKDLNLPAGSLCLKGLRVPPTAASALGAAISALGKGRVNIDLLPSSTVRKANAGYVQTLALTSAVGALLLLTGATYIVKDLVTLKRLESALSTARLEKGKVQVLTDSLKSANEHIRALEEIKGGTAPGALEVLKELTGVLPAGTWLSDFEYNGGVVFVEGFSEMASSQLLKIEQSGMLKDSEFAGPVTKGKGGKEHFRIKFSVRNYNELKEVGKGAR